MSTYETAPIPPVPEQPWPDPAGAVRRPRRFAGKYGLPVLVGVGGVLTGAVLAFGVTTAGQGNTVDAGGAADE
jgi:hypothetical protein